MLLRASHYWSTCVPNNDVSSEERWPGVTPAYDFVRVSYDWMMHRLNAVESRIQTLMMFSASFTVTGPVLVALLAEEASLRSGWFVAAVALALVNLLIGAIARAYGGLKLLGVHRIYDEWLEHNDWQFKRSAVYWAGSHFEWNSNLVNWKSKAVAVMTLAFILEAALMLVWGLGEAGRS